MKLRFTSPKAKQPRRIIHQYFLPHRRVGHPLRDEVEQFDRVHLVRVREIRIVAARDDALGRGLDQRVRNRKSVALR